MPNFTFMPTPLSGLLLVQRTPIEDQRGFFSRFYCAEEFRKIGIQKSVVQINHALTRKKGTVRGLHFQYPPHAETKLVSCLKGGIWDVAVDLRLHSPTFLQWHSEILSSENHRSLLIPDGFAHGFQTLTDDCELIYLHTEDYYPESEGSLNVTDPSLKISFPLPIRELSDKDRNHPYINQTFHGITL